MVFSFIPFELANLPGSGTMGRTRTGSHPPVLKKVLPGWKTNKTQACINKASADSMIIDYYEHWLTLSTAGSSMQMFHLCLDSLQIHLQDLRRSFYSYTLYRCSTEEKEGCKIWVLEQTGFLPKNEVNQQKRKHANCKIDQWKSY